MIIHVIKDCSNKFFDYTHKILNFIQYRGKPYTVTVNRVYTLTYKNNIINIIEKFVIDENGQKLYIEKVYSPQSKKWEINLSPSIV